MWPPGSNKIKLLFSENLNPEEERQTGTNVFPDFSLSLSLFNDNRINPRKIIKRKKLSTWNNWIKPINDLASWSELVKRRRKGCIRNNVAIRHVPGALLFPYHGQIWTATISPLQIIMNLSSSPVARRVHLLPADVTRRRAARRRRSYGHSLHDDFEPEREKNNLFK